MVCFFAVFITYEKFVKYRLVCDIFVASSFAKQCFIN